MPIETLGAMTIPAFCRQYATGRTRAYELIGSGAIKAKKFGATTLIDRASAELAIYACEQREAARGRRLVIDLTTSTGSAAIVNQALGVGDAHTAAMLGPCPPHFEMTELER